MRALDPFTQAIARHDIGPREEVVVSNDVDVEVLLSELAAHRLIGAAAAAVESGSLQLGHAATEALRRRHDAVMATTMQVELALLEVDELLERASVPRRVLKGSALAHTVAWDPAEREFRDVDLLVPGDSIDRAVECLLGAGAERLRPELRAGYDRRFAKSVTLRLGEVEIDLHRTLCDGPFGAMSLPGDLLVLRRTFELGGRTLSTLDRTDHLLHACYHAALGAGDPVLCNLRDVMLLAAGDFDLPRLQETVARWNGTAVIARAVQLIERDLELEAPAALRVFTMSTDGRRMLAPYLRSEDRFSALAAATLRVLPVADRAAYALAVGLPEGANPADRARELWRRQRATD